MLDPTALRRATERLVGRGEVPPGTRAEVELAKELAEGFERMGLSVEIHRFGCASWAEESVHLEVDGRAVEAVAMPPSPSGYVEGELVHAGVGRSLALEGVEGRVALVGMTEEDPDFAAVQYALLAASGASAVVFYDFRPNLLRRIVVEAVISYGDGPGLPPPIPVVAINGELGRRLAEGRHYVQLEVRARYDEGASSANVIAYDSGEAKVLVAAHYDRWLAGAADDAVGVAMLQQLPALLRGRRGVAYALFGCEEYGAPGYSAWYWAWGSRKYVEYLRSKGELDNLVAVLNTDVASRRPLTISASGPEFREAARALLGSSFEYELDSPYFDSFSFSSSGVPALTVHSLWRYVDLYHSSGDLPSAIDWEAVLQAGWALSKLAEELVEKGAGFFRYGAWREELLALLARASRYRPPPAELAKLLEALSVDEAGARVLRRRAIAVVCEGEPLEPRILVCRAFPQLLVVNDLELLERVIGGGAELGELAKLRRRWTAKEVRELPCVVLDRLVGLLARMGPKGAREYLERAKASGELWLERAYAELLELLQGLR